MIAKNKLSAETFEEICEGLGPCELVRGEVVHLVPGGGEHSEVSVNVAALLWVWARQTKLGRVWSNEAGIVVEEDPDTVRGADVAFISYERLPQGERPPGFSRIPPELVVEVVGRGQTWADMVEKAGEYLKMGVDRVWILDPGSRRLHIYRSDAEPVTLGEADILSDEAILPGFSARVSEFFAE